VDIDAGAGTGEQVLQRTLDALPVAVEHRGADGRLAYLTPLARELFATYGIDADALVGSDLGPFDHLEVVDQRGIRLRPSDLPIAACLADGRPHAETVGVPSPHRPARGGQEHEQPLDIVEGRREDTPAPWILDHRWFHVRATAVPLLDGSRGVAVTYLDVTQQHHLGEALRQAALHDPLTGLANGRLLALRFQQSRATAQRTGTRLGLAYIDLDRFRLVNDLLGHLAGDRLLRQIGERLAAVTREADTTARVAGDEFVVLCTSLTGEDAMRSAAARIASAVDGTVALGDRRATIGASVGWAMVDRDSDLDTALHRADSAMGLEKARRSIS
jgi:diguanylate cyclase (GGDEF)-like protein